MQRNKLYKAIGMFFVIVGAMVMGIAAGMGFVAYIVKQRLVCVAGVENACHDILEPVMNMVGISALGGFVAFIAGLAAIGLIMRDEQMNGGEQ